MMENPIWLLIWSGSSNPKPFDDTIQIRQPLHMTTFYHMICLIWATHHATYTAYTRPEKLPIFPDKSLYKSHEILC